MLRRSFILALCIILSVIVDAQKSSIEIAYVDDPGYVISGQLQLNKWLSADLGVNVPTEELITAGPTITSLGGLKAKLPKGFSGSFRYRFMGDRPANETNSVKTENYLLFDLVVTYNIRNLEITLSGENFLNRVWKESPSDTESRLQFEPPPVSEYHYSPGMPMTVKFGVTFSF